MTPPRDPRRAASAGPRSGGHNNAGGRRSRQIKPPRFGPEWYKKRRLRTKRRVAAMSRKRRAWRRVGIFGTWALATVAVVLIVAVVGFYALTNVRTPDQIKTDQVATVLYSDGSVMARLGSENRTDVAIGQVPEDVKWDVLAAEDRNYYSNPGVSITGTLRAAWNDVTGGDTQGGSGITQQYVKNAYLNDDQTLTRKLKELAIAVKLDRNYSKDQIFEYYLNTIYFGRGAYGIQAAAQQYFGVNVQQLNVAQGAVLASVIRSPSYYDPATNPQAAQDRFRYVLDGMVATGHLTEAQAQAMTFPTVNPPASNGLGIPDGPAGLIVQQVQAELANDGISEQELNTRGLVIQTTIDPKAQTDAQNAISDVFSDLDPDQGPVKKALVAVDPTSGAVKAYWGGDNNSSDYHDYAGVTCQAPGSSFKPYTLAVGLNNTLQGTKPGYSLASVVDGSSPQTIDGVQIANDPSDRQYSSSRITVARAMEVSLNTVFDSMANAVGPNNVATMAHTAGVQDAPCNGVPSLAGTDGQTSFGIGIGDYPVRTIDQAVGFSTFANNGIVNKAYFVQKITDAKGAVVYEHKTAGTAVVDSKVANDITASLVPVAGFSRTPLASSRMSASKTGTEGIQFCKDGKAPDDTTDANGNCDDVGQNSDAWTVGYTPQISVAVWAGSGDSTTAIRAKGGGPEYGRDMPGKTWQTFMNAYLDGAPKMTLPTKAEVTGGQNVEPTSEPTRPAPTTSAPSTPTAPTTAPTTPTTPTTPAVPTTPTTPQPTPTTPNGGGGVLPPILGNPQQARNGAGG